MGLCLSCFLVLPDDGRYHHAHQKPQDIVVLHHQQLKPPLQQTMTMPPNPNYVHTHDDSILGKPYEDVKAHFALGKELGRGRFGITCRCIENSTGKPYACKSVHKKHLVNEEDRVDMRREVQILQLLTGQTNIVEFKGAYEDTCFVHVVMELCSDGDLLDGINKKGPYTEEEAATICRDMVNAVHSCHSMGVIHRDLKLENLLLSRNGEGGVVLKVADFGLSVFMEETTLRCDIVGTVNYVAPEVIVSSYGKEVDIWSAGVILYVLLSGRAFPFWAESGEDEDVFKAILQGKLDFESAPWPKISSSAKDLVRKMLTQDPKGRITSSQVLEHPWIREHGKAGQK